MNDSVRVETGHVKYRLKSVKPPDFPNHRQHTQTEDEVECHSSGPDFSPHYHQKRTGGNDAQLQKHASGRNPFGYLLTYELTTNLGHALVKDFLILPLPLTMCKSTDKYCRCKSGPALTKHVQTLPGTWCTQTLTHIVMVINPLNGQPHCE